MTNYQVEVSFNEIMFIEAASKDEAEEIAINMMEDDYGIPLGMTIIEEIKEVK